MQRVSVRLAGAAVLIFLASFFGAAFLNFAKFEQTYVTLAQERYDSVMRDLKRTIESTLGIGLSLSASQSVQGVIDRIVVQYDDRFRITVIGPNGAELFSTSDIPSAVIADLDSFASLTAAGGRTATVRIDHVRIADNFVSVIDILNPLGEREGSVLLDHDGSTLRATIERLSGLMWGGVLVLSAIFVVTIALAVFLVVWPAERRFYRAGATLRALISGEPVPPGVDEMAGFGVEDARTLVGELNSAERHFQLPAEAPPANSAVTSERAS